MRYRVSAYFLVVLGVSTGLVALQNVRIAGAYLVACAAIAIPLRWLRVPERYYYVMLFGGVALWVSYLVRPLLLVAVPSSFAYPRVGSATESLINVVLLQVAAFSALFLGGTWLGFRITPPVRPRRSIRAPDPEDPLLVRTRVLVLSLLCALVVLRAYLQFQVGLYTKLAAPNPTLGFIARLIPDLLIYGVPVIYLLKYRSKISIAQRIVSMGILLAMGVMGLLSGSKAFLILPGTILFIYFLADRGDFRISPIRAGALALLVFWIFLVSFAVAIPLRPLVGSQGYSLDLGPVILEGVSAAVRFDRKELFFYGNLITGRLNGFDGLLATDLSRPDPVLDAFAPVNTGFRIAEKLIPRFVGVGGMQSGQAVGIHYSGLSREVQHEGAVGIFGALRLTFGPAGAYVAAALLGMFWALYFRFSERWRQADARLLLQMIGAMNVVAWVLSGNFDETASAFLIALVHLAFYVGLIGFMEAGLNPRLRRGPAGGPRPVGTLPGAP